MGLTAIVQPHMADFSGAKVNKKFSLAKKTIKKGGKKGKVF